MDNFNTFSTLLQQELSDLHLTLDNEQEQQFFAYFQELQKWNRKINLSGSDNELFVIQQHFVDSLSCALAAVPFQQAHLLDIGTGAGFPGVPLKIYFPQMRLTLVDAVSKKILFLRHLCRQLRLSEVNCLSARLPTSELPAGSFDLIVSRAVGALQELLLLAVPLLAPDGAILLQRGKEGLQEVEHCRDFLQAQGLSLVESKELRFSFLDYPRYLLTFRFL